MHHRFATPEQRRYALIFVHGLGGSAQGTWGDFPALLAADPDLPAIHLSGFGYRSRLLPSDPDLLKIGRRFVSYLRTETHEDEHTFLVGHSMGGLVICAALRELMLAGGPFFAPDSARKLRHISLYASPLLGSPIATWLRVLVPFLGALLTFVLTRWLTSVVALSLLGYCVSAAGCVWAAMGVSRWLFSRQVHQLAEGQYVNDLQRDIVARVVKPDLVRFSCYTAEDDSLVPHHARGVLDLGEPKQLPGTHGSVKLPTSRDDPAYKALRVDIDNHLGGDLIGLVQDCCDASSVNRRKVAYAQVRSLYHNALKTRVEQLLKHYPQHPRARLEHDLCVLTFELALALPQGRSARPGALLDQAMLAIRDFGPTGTTNAPGA